MVKRIIFDFDNTLVAFNKEWDIEVNRTFDDYNIEYDEEILRKFQESLSKYEKETTIVDYDDADKYFSNYIGIDLPKGFIKSWTMRLSKVKPPVDKRLNEMLERLSKKYSLVVATNWFRDLQYEKAKHIEITDYLDEFMTGDRMKVKPNKDMFEYFLNGYTPDEVIVVGDVYYKDIVPGLELGMHGYLLSDNKEYESDKCTLIKDIYELEKYL